MVYCKEYGDFFKHKEYGPGHMAKLPELESQLMKDKKLIGIFIFGTTVNCISDYFYTYFDCPSCGQKVGEYEKNMNWKFIKENFNNVFEGEELNGTD